MGSLTLAIVVTYHRPELLQACLQALLGQKLADSDRLELLVVDNACTDQTPVLLDRLQQEEPSLHVIRMQQNGGGAGGFHQGMLWALTSYSQSPDYLWLLDDDTIASPDALRHLLDCRSSFVRQTLHEPAFVCSRVLWRDGSVCEMNIPTPVWDWIRFHYCPTMHPQGSLPIGPSLVDSCSFVSVLIRREHVQRAGLPIEDFFIWCDDQEYTRRLCQLGYPGLYSPLSIVVHQTKDNRGVNPSLMNEAEVWKYCYGFRNNAYLHRRRGVHWLTFFLFCRIRDIWSAPVKLKSKLAMLGWLLNGAIVFKPEVVTSISGKSARRVDSVQLPAKPLTSQ